MIPFLIILILVLLNALYVAAEFAAVSVSRPRLQQLADEGSISAQRLLPILSDPHALDRYVAACQVGITLASLILGAYGQVALSGLITPYFDGLGNFEKETAQGTAAVIILVGLTAFQMILGELIPKSLALQFPAKVAMALTTPMIASLQFLDPFIKFLNGSGTIFLKMIGVPQTSHRHVHSAEEMAMLFSESREGGLIETVEHERLAQALQLENRKVSEIMVPQKQMRVLDVSTDLDGVLKAMAEHPYTRWPVFQDSPDSIIGIAHARDVARIALDSSRPFDLKRVIRKPLIVHQGMTADDLLSIMRIEHKQLAVVINELGTPVGLVGISDVLDELLGDISERRPGKPVSPVAVKP